MIRILIADSYYLSMSGLVTILSNQSGFEVVCQTQDCESLANDVAAYDPDVIIFDVNMQNTIINESIETCLSKIRAKILILADKPEDQVIIQLLRIGANGCILKNEGETFLIESIRDIMEDKSPISPSVACQILKYMRSSHSNSNFGNGNATLLSHREVTVLRLLAEGNPNKIIGNQLNISERTVEAHVRNILRKLNATSRTQAAFLATKYGWLN